MARNYTVSGVSCGEGGRGDTQKSLQTLPKPSSFVISVLWA